MKPVFNIGDKVQKSRGYKFPGIVVGVNLIPTCTEDSHNFYYRYTVLAVHPTIIGMLHIFNDEQLQIRTQQYELDSQILSTLRYKGLIA